jgi:hypothetical protein
MYYYLTGIFGHRGSAVPSRPTALRYFLVLIIIISTSFKIQAQDFFPEQTNYAIRIGSDAELPGKNMGDYRRTLGYNIGLMRLLDHITVGINLSYREFSPKTLLAITQIDAAHQSTITYSNYTAFLAYINGAYNVPLTQALNVYGGVNIGLGYNTSYSRYATDNSSTSLGGGCKQIYLAPQLGFGFAVSNNLEVDIHAGYNLFMQSGNITNDASSGFTGVAPTSYSAIMTGVGLIFKF